MASSRRSLAEGLLWLLPVAFCLVLYGRGLFAWYQMDDFAWLYQRYRVHSLSDFFQVVFTPTVHGTWRPWSERIPFLLSSYLFDGNAVPFRILVFLTVFADYALLCLVMRKLTRSRLAAVSAPMLWTVNSALAFVMAWSSAYMQILCGFCLLLAFYLFLKYLESGRRLYWWLQVLVFVFGLGVMETMAVYPLLVLLYALLFARQYLRHGLLLLAGSVVFVLLHFQFAPGITTGPYAMHVDLGMLQVFQSYWRLSLVPPTLTQLHPRLPAWSPDAIVTVLTLAQVLYVGWAAWRRNFLPLFFTGAFVILLAPVLPLRDHITDYYLTLPALALGALWATALVDAWRRGIVSSMLAVGLAVLFAGAHWSTSRFAVKWWTERSQRIEHVIGQVQAAHNRTPEKTIVLADVNEEFYTGAVRDLAFPALGMPEVYLDGDGVKALPATYLEAASKYVLAPAKLENLQATGRLMVLSIKQPEVREITAAAPPSRIEVFRPEAAPWVGPTWHEIEPTQRWMPKSATVKLRAPKSQSEQLHLTGYCPLEQVPVTLRVLANGEPAGQPVVLKKEGLLNLVFPLSPSVIGKDQMEITLQVDHTFRKGHDVRDLGLVVMALEVK